MAKITGMLFSDLLADGTVTINFASEECSEKGFAIKLNDLDAAETYFVHTLQMAPKLAAALRLGMERNKVVFLGMSIKEEIFAEMHLSHA
jgi:hypothetical protein